MDIVIRETGEKKSLSIIDSKGVDRFDDLIGNAGALGSLGDGQFIFDDHLDALVCDNETFKRWEKVVNEKQEKEGVNKISNTDKTRRAKCDASKREKGLFKPSIWVHKENGEAIKRIAEVLQSPAEIDMEQDGKAMVITVIRQQLN